MKAWVARDKDGEIWMFLEFPPYKSQEDEMWRPDDHYVQLDDSLFPSVKWEDEEPTEVEITIKLKKKWPG